MLESTLQFRPSGVVLLYFEYRPGLCNAAVERKDRSKLAYFNILTNLILRREFPPNYLTYFNIERGICIGCEILYIFLHKNVSFFRFLFNSSAFFVKTCFFFHLFCYFFPAFNSPLLRRKIVSNAQVSSGPNGIVPKFF